MTNLSDLISRIEGATECNERRLAGLACDIHHRLLAPTPRGYMRGSASGRYLMFHKNRGHGTQSVTVPDYLGSLDAALALTERVLPGWFAIYLSAEFSGGADRTWSSVTGEYRCTLARAKDSYVQVEAVASSLALALVLATLRSLEQKGETK